MCHIPHHTRALALSFAYHTCCLFCGAHKSPILDPIGDLKTLLFVPPRPPPLSFFSRDSGHKHLLVESSHSSTTTLQLKAQGASLSSAAAAKRRASARAPLSLSPDADRRAAAIADDARATLSLSRNKENKRMGLLTIIRKVKRKEREMRVLMVGLDNAGKTTAVRRLKDGGGDGQGISPTLGFSICSLTRRGRKLNVWDVGGQRSLRPYWRNYFERTDGVVWVVDSSDLARLRDARRELELLLGEERLAGATLLVLANKQDVKGALGLEAISEAVGLQSSPAAPVCPPAAAVESAGAGGGAGGAGAGAETGAAQEVAAAAGKKEAAAAPGAAVGKRRHWRVAACSARTGAGLGEAFDWIVDDVASRIYMFDD
jgi:ADP-ribosylation factor-like protein 2